MKSYLVSSLLVLLMAGANATASTKPEPAVNADTKEAFATVSTWVRKQMEDGGRYAHVTSTERGKVDARLTEMGTLLEQKGSVAQMSDAEKTKMFNDQEEVNAILASRDNDRLICKSVAPVGSHLPVKTCKTYGELQEEQRITQDTMRRKQDQMQGQTMSGK